MYGQKFFRFFLILIPLAFLPLGAWGAQENLVDKPTPGNFANMQEISTVDEGGLYRFPLSEAVYRGIVHSQYGDLAVFNSRGEIVPFLLRAQTTVAAASEVRPTRVPFFELPTDGPQAGNGTPSPLDIYVRTGSTGQIVEIKGRSGSKTRTQDRRYILDLSNISLDGSFKSRSLGLGVPENLKLMGDVALFQSDNLRSWTPLVSKMPLVQLQNSEGSLRTTEIPLSARPERYLLLQIGSVPSEFQLQDIVYKAEEERLVSPGYEEKTFEGKLAGDNLSIEYDIGGAFPVEKIDFVLQEAGLYPVRFASRPEVKAAWRELGRMELSMINAGGTVRRNQPLSIRLLENRYWRLEFEKPFSGRPPMMRIFWRSSELYFLAQGGAPYTLAFGSSSIFPQLQNENLLRDAQVRESAVKTTLGSLLSAPERQAVVDSGAGTDWQRYLVWAILVLGGILLSGMAWRLLKISKGSAD